MPLGILLLFLVRGTGEFAATYGIGWIGRQIIKKLRGEVFTKFLGLPTRFFDTTVAGMQLSKLTFNIEQVADATSNVITVLIRDSLTTVGLIAYMVYLSPVLTAFRVYCGAGAGRVDHGRWRACFAVTVRASRSPWAI